ncbi:hypothetical protein GOARA_052_00510 [Gordonia araii NBRC 100433]|uniref:Lipoprotein n=1 Tax=Gordonia araii NBRC 100433 TaxID=1073574 RepID=G7H2S7_9ACTN|nr:hypothetical protein [Gordonia araii]NNG98522.1 hypothetical protein [Gordonia araii NBRC 100433]GAB10152.1 hypothetical protein GOARA_052_00510 [Gordonia araii NBRC 100433]
MLTRFATTSTLRRAAAIPLAGVLAALLVACGGGDDAVDDGPCATGATTADPAVRPIPLAAPTVELISAGAAPHRVLRAAPDRASAQQVRATSTTTVLSRLADDGAGAPAEGDAASREDQTVTVGLTVRHHCSDDQDVALRFDTLTATDPVLSADLGKDAGSRGGLTLGAGGVPVSLRLWPNPGAPTTARAVIENTLATALQNLVAVPSEPVGVGASWRAVRTVLGATPVRQTVTATLRARTGDTVDLDISVDETPTGSDYTVPGTGKTLRIARYTALGKGTARLDLRRALPVGGSLDVRGARELVGADAGRPLVQQTRYQLQWSR